MKYEHQPCFRRRNMVKIMALSLATPPSFVVTPSKAASKQIVVRDTGGIYSEVYADLLYKPFTQATGIEVVKVTSEMNPTAKIQTMVETKRYLWDLAELSERDILVLTTGTVYLEKHELEDDPIISSIPPQFRSSYGVGAYLYMMALTYRTDIFKGRRTPASWRDLWDIHRFPGRRGLLKLPFYTIETALMADGVPLDEVYPCDLDRAFRSLDKLRPHVAVWWTSGPQSEQLLKSGEIDLTLASNTILQAAIAAGVPLGFSWHQSLYGCMNWTILKGTPNVEACREFIKFASDPKRQALLAPYGIGATHPDAFKYIDPKHAIRLPTYPDNLKKGLFIDAAYWAKHQQAAIERFNDWILS